MEFVIRLLQEISSNKFEVGSCLWVDIVHIDDPYNFYIRPTSYRRYLPLLQTQGDHPSESEFKVGNIFIYHSVKLKCNVRGKIVSYEKKYSSFIICKMLAIDYGCTEEGVSIKRIWRTVYELEVPSLATLCQLADCMPRGETWDSYDSDAMQCYVNGEKAKMIIKSKSADKLFIDLYNSRDDDIATLLDVID